MRINKQMNLVVPIVEEYEVDGETKERNIAYVHSAPISSEVFDANFLVMTRTYAQTITLGLGMVGGPSIADKLLRKTAQDMGVWDGPNGVQAGLMNQIYRLTNVLHVGDRGWQLTPYEIAKKTVLETEEVSEVESALVYFTCASRGIRHHQRNDLVGGALAMWGAQTTSLNSTDFLNTLPALSLPASIGARKVG